MGVGILRKIYILPDELENKLTASCQFRKVPTSLRCMFPVTFNNKFSHRCFNSYIWGLPTFIWYCHFGFLLKLYYKFDKFSCSLFVFAALPVALFCLLCFSFTRRLLLFRVSSWPMVRSTVLRQLTTAAEGIDPNYK